MANSGRQSDRIGKRLSQSVPIDALIARIAASQFGLITLAQLYDLGLTYREVHRRIESGRLFPLHRAVYAVGHLDISPKGHLKAALLALGDTSFLSHHTSLAAQGLRPINTRRIELTVVADRTPKRPGLIIHRTAAEPHRHEVRHRLGLRYSSLARSLIEIAPQENPAEILRLVTAGIRKNLVDVRAIGECLDRHSQRPGVGIVRSALGRYVDPVDRKSELEISFDKHCAADPRIPPYRRNIHLGPHEWDVVFEHDQLVVELDGRPYHVAIQDMENDRAKDIWAQRHGLRVMRITDFTWEHGRAEAIDDLLALLALGGSQPRAA